MKNEKSPDINQNFWDAQSRNRTSDTRIFSPLLYRLSYLGLGIDLTLVRVQNLKSIAFEITALPPI